MTEHEQQEQQERVSKRAFIAKVAHRSGLPIKVVTKVYDTGLAELMDIVTNGDQLMLTGFGKFYPQAHKGHRVQFADSGSKVIDDYHVLKFSATRSVNKLLALPPGEAEGDAVEGQDVEPKVPVAKTKVAAKPRTKTASGAKATVTQAKRTAGTKAVGAKDVKVVAAEEKV